MNSIVRSVLALLALGCCCGLAFGEDSPADTKAELLMLADLRGGSPSVFKYTSWSDAVLPAASGVTISGAKGARGDGGIGGNLTPVRDFTGVRFIDLALGVGAANEVPVVTVALNDADGTQVSAQLRIGQIVPNQPVWLQLPVSDFRTVGGFEGKTPGMDWSNIVQWHIQGDWVTQKPFHMVFIALRGRP